MNEGKKITVQKDAYQAFLNGFASRIYYRVRYIYTFEYKPS